jgi:hypothetical protein
MLKVKVKVEVEVKAQVKLRRDGTQARMIVQVSVSRPSASRQPRNGVANTGQPIFDGIGGGAVLLLPLHRALHRLTSAPPKQEQEHGPPSSLVLRHSS